MIPILPILLVGALSTYFLSKDKKTVDKKTTPKIPLSKLPSKIRFYDDGISIDTRKYEIYLNKKWNRVTEAEYNYISVYSGGHDDKFEYNRRNKIEKGKFVFYKENI